MYDINLPERLGRLGDELRRISGELEPGGGIKGSDIAGFIGERGEPINCYPGVPGGGCHEEAYFISLKSPKYTAPRGKHLGLSEAMQKLVQHMQGHCIGITRQAYVVCDNWQPELADPWRSNIKVIRDSGCVVQIWLYNDGQFTMLPW
jgi:hypothetical protein